MKSKNKFLNNIEILDQENTKKIIGFLSKQNIVKEILYPFKKGSSNYENWKK